MDSQKYNQQIVENPKIKIQDLLIPGDLLLFLPIKIDMIQQPPSCELSVSLSQLLAPLFLFAFSGISLSPSIYPTSGAHHIEFLRGHK